MKNSEIQYYAEGLEMLLKHKLSFLAGFQKMEIIAIRRQLQERFKDVQDARMAEIMRYAELDTGGNLIYQQGDNIKIRDNEITELNSKLTELFETEVDLNIKTSPIRIPQHNDIEPQALELLMLLSSEPTRIFIE